MFFLTWFADHRGPAGFLQNESRGQIMYQPENPQLQKLTDLSIWFKKVSFFISSSRSSPKPHPILAPRLPTGYSEVQLWMSVNPTWISHRGITDLYTSKDFNRIEKAVANKVLALGCNVNFYKWRFLTFWNN